jgi:transketolase
MDTLTAKERTELERTALNIRRKILRMIKAGHSGHVGGAMSIVELVAALYFKIMRVDPGNPAWEERDRLILSAGHKCLALYAVLAEKGFFDESLLDTYGCLSCRLPGHPDMHKLPGVEASTGALGHGLSIAGGIAMGHKMTDSDVRTYVIMGDGELAEGSNWEAAAAASHHELDNLVVFVDRNRLQIGGPTVEVMSYEPLDERWRSFGWSVRTIDGHDFDQIVENAGDIPFQAGKPSVIIADTVKSRGLSFAEDDAGYHYWSPTPEEMAQAEEDLAEMEEALES